MKKKFLFISAALLALLLASNCKNKNNDTETFECVNSNFINTLTLQLTPTYVEEDSKGNILVLGHFDQLVKIAKFDTQGELLWQKEYPQLQGKEQGLVYIDENTFFIKTSTNHYEYELSANGYENIWIKNSNMLDASNNYIPTYELYSGRPKLQLPNSNKTYLSKISADGAVIWTKEFKGDACNGNSFFRIDNNNFLFLTSEFWGHYYELIEHNGIADTVNYPNNRNRRTVYKIDNNGEVIWSTEIENIFNVNWDPGGDYSHGFQHSITQSNDRITVNTLNNTYELSASGELVKSYQPAFNFQGNWTFFMERATETENYFFGEKHTANSVLAERYLLKYNLVSQQTTWKKMNAQFPLQLSSYPNKGFISSFYGIPFTIKKFDNDGHELWQTEVQNSWGTLIIKAACNGGAIIAKYDNEKEEFILIKTNEDGVY
jgi:hypothetical protein